MRWPLGPAPPAAWSPLQVVAALAGAIVLAAVVNTFLRYGAAVAATALSQRVLIQLRSDVYDKLQRLSFRFYDAADSGSLINRAASDVNAVRAFVDGVIVKILTVLLSLTAYLLYMLWIHAPLTLACLATPLLWLGA